MKRYSLILIIMAITLTLWGESLLTLDMKMLQALTRSQAADAWYFTGIGSADLTIKSTGNRDVKGELSLIYVPMEAVTAAGTPPANVSAVILDKASIKVQFPSLRLTMGKTRIGWGEGYVFNSGDVLYGSLSPSVDLTADSARNETAWLTLIRWSPGRTYVEAIAMAPAMNLTDTVNPMATGKPGEIWDSSAGVRLVTNILDLDLQLGYLFKGEIKTPGDQEGHRPYVSFHGYGEVDWYGSGSLSVPFEGADWESNIRETVNMSFGAYKQFGLGYDGTLSVRLETLVYPWQQWQARSAGLAADESYGLYLYPEMVFGIGRGISLPLMAVVSPLEQSAKLTAGFTAQVYQGFNFLAYVNGSLGDSTDTFTTGDLSFMAGMRFKY
jgi:hypothetical protein